MNRCYSNRVTVFLVSLWNHQRSSSSAFPTSSFLLSPSRNSFATTCPSASTLTYSRMAMSSTTATETSTDAASCSNPLLSDWSNQPFHLPPFAAIEPSHFEEALEAGMKAHLEDLQAIVDTQDKDNAFESIVAAYDRAGSLLSKVQSVYGNMCSSLNTPELQEIQTKLSPILSRHSSQARFFPGLFAKIASVHENRTALDLTPEQLRLVERVYRDLERAGAGLDAETQDQLANLNAQLATLTTQFTQNVMKDEETYELVLTKLQMLEGCPESLIAAARAAAEERGKANDEYVITLARSLVEPFLTYSSNRDLRKQAWEAWTKRGELHPDRDNLVIATDILKLRQQIANLHGYPNFAAYQCSDNMAQTPEKVMELLTNVWERAKVVAQQERADLEAFVAENGESLDGGIQAWDWRYYAEKVRLAKYDLDESLLRPYFSLDRMTEAMFAVSQNLFGLRYHKREDIQAYHEDVDVYEVYQQTTGGGEDDEKLVALFLHDNFARPFKASGAWMSEYRSQSRNLNPGDDAILSIPIVSNNNNLAKSGGTTLLSYDDANTLFHEFGHGHHGMLSDATYHRLASTNVATDFVELPSQLYEHWLDHMIPKYAKHAETGAPIPQELLDKLEQARSFQQGFQTVEYTICALLDMALHQQDDYTNFDLAKFEASELERLGMPAGIVMRHRPAHFQHLFSTNMYAAGYYVYQWAEVLDADVFAEFVEQGDVFHPETAAKARQFIYGAGNTVAPEELFRQFRGRDPDIQFMLKKKGLLVEQ